ncbi:MAG: hypothetical protein M3188_01055 [Actinomycetota bacterium]|nr:hypothetical protein [Actinomycetota bacterium]
MFVRIARFEGDPSDADQAVAQVRERMKGERPPGLEGLNRVLMLVDRESGRGLGLTFFETQDDLRRGDEALNAMTPQGSSRRTSVETYEVGLDVEL